MVFPFYFCELNCTLSTAGEVAEVLRIGKVKAYEIMKTGELASFRVGQRNIRTTRQALENYIQSQLRKEVS
ncbi:MAG: helix-turn-helix domain-containing protein [Bacillota bacterium]|jgi:excisionase family DNA binding protein